MVEWPSYYQFVLLLAGLLPPLMLTFRVARGGVNALVSLDSLFVGSVWVGYHLTPWLAISTGGWSSRALIPSYIDYALTFSFLSMLAFLVGYGHFSVGVTGGFSRRIDRITHLINFYTPSIQLVLAISGLAFSLVVLRTNGLDNLWAADYSRGSGQFRPMEFWDKIYRVLVIASKYVSVGLALISSALLFGRNRSSQAYLVGIVGLSVATLPYAFSFSRGAGYAFVMASFIAFYRWRFRKWTWVLALLFIGGLLSWTGWTERSNFRPGVGNFIQAIFSTEPTSSSAESGAVALDPASNPLNATDRFTARAWTRDLDNRYEVLAGLEDFILAIQPFPSQFLPFKVSAGTELTYVLGTWGSHRVTTPALAELYYWFGFWGALLLVPFGRLCAFIDLYKQKSDSILLLLLWGGAAVGFVGGLHSGVRAMTRPMVYVFSLLVLSRILASDGRRKQ